MNSDPVMKVWFDHFKNEIVAMWTGTNTADPGPVMGVGGSSVGFPPEHVSMMTVAEDKQAKQIIALELLVKDLQAQVRAIYHHCAACGDEHEVLGSLLCKPCQISLAYARQKMFEEARVVFDEIAKEARG